MKTAQLRRERALALHDVYSKQRNHFAGKAERARKYENAEKAYLKFKKYNSLADRAWRIWWFSYLMGKTGTLLSPENANCTETRATKQSAFIKARQKNKAKRKEEFESTYRVYLHFYSASLRADYGTNTCQKCQWKFHHSPATIHRGRNKLFECACGNCTNSLLERNKQEVIYH